MVQKIKVLKKYRYSFCLGALFVIAFLLRAYRIGEVPNIMHVDEAASGYNAWCLANYGVDRYLNEWPIYPQNYTYGGQSPLYTYCLVLLLKLFPRAKMTVELVRVPALLSSMLAVISSSKMFGMIFKNKKITLAGTALVAFCPYFIMAGRYALDCNMMFGTSVLALTLLLHYLQKNTWSALFLCGGGFALVLYSYAISYMVIPIFLVSISLYMLYTRKINIGRLLALASVVCVLGLPIILFVICIVFGLPGFHLLGIQILPIAAGRVNEIAQTAFWPNIFDCIKITLTHNSYILDAVDKYYTMYVISIPFIAVGFVWALIDFVKTLRSRSFAVSAIFIMYVSAVLIAIGLASSGRIYRANAIFVCYLYFCITGICQIFRFLRHYRRAFGMIVCVSYAIWIMAFLRYYFMVYSAADSYSYPNSYYFTLEEEALTYVVEEQNANVVYIDSFFEEYFYFYYPCNPYETEKTDPSGRMREFCMWVDYYTPIEEDAIYMVHKGNREFLEKLRNSGVDYDTEEFTHYYVFLVP